MIHKGHTWGDDVNLPRVHVEAEVSLEGFLSQIVVTNFAFERFFFHEQMHCVNGKLVITNSTFFSLIKQSNINPRPKYYGKISAGGKINGILAEFIKSALNQNNLKWHSAPANSEIEKITIKWISEFIGYNHKKRGGVLVSGGSVANLMNIAVMRKIKGENFLSKEGIYNNQKMRVYVSKDAHSSICLLYTSPSPRD